MTNIIPILSLQIMLNRLRLQIVLIQNRTECTNIVLVSSMYCHWYNLTVKCRKSYIIEYVIDLPYYFITGLSIIMYIKTCLFNVLVKNFV